MSNAAAVESTADNTIDYVDQMFFLSLRALGHSPVIQFVWIYDSRLDLPELERFQANLGHSLLSRRIERSPIPWGRHRWVSWRPPSKLHIASSARPRSELMAWADEQCERPVDPEFGPPWRLDIQPLDGGGNAVSLVVSHTVADGVGVCEAVSDAVEGLSRDLGYPIPDSRTRVRALVADFRAFVLGLPAIARALASVPKAAQGGTRWLPARAKVSADSRGNSKTVRLHSATAHVELAQWDERAAILGGTSNSLFLGLVARMAELLGWTSSEGDVTLALPVNQRTYGDTRGNALAGVNVKVDPETVSKELSGVRAELKAALSSLTDENVLKGPLPLSPLIPKFVSRRAETAVFKSAMVNASNLGDIDPRVNRPDGTDADWFVIRSRWAELNVPTSAIQRSGGMLCPLISGRLNGSVFLSVGLATTDDAASPELLRQSLRTVLSDFGLRGVIE